MQIGYSFVMKKCEAMHGLLRLMVCQGQFPETAANALENDTRATNQHPSWLQGLPSLPLKPNIIKFSQYLFQQPLWYLSS